MSESPLYLFCVTTDDTVLAQEGLELDLMLVSYSGLHMVVRSTTLQEFEGLEPGADGEIPASLTDLVLRHDRVVRAVAERGPVLPMRFGMGVADRSGIMEYLQREEANLKAQVEWIRDHKEWGVKWKRLSPPPPESAQAESAADSGRSYLRRRHRELRSEEQAAILFRNRAEEVHQELASLARAVSPSESGAAGDELGSAYLVATGREEAFLSRVAASVDQLAREGIEMHLTGPWPPYSFVLPKAVGERTHG